MAFFVSGQEITPDPADPSIPLLIRSANLHPVDVRQQPKIAVLQFLEPQKALRERGNMLNSPIHPQKAPYSLTEARKTHFKHLTHTNYRVMPLKVYNGFEGVLAAYSARSSFAPFTYRTVHLKIF